MGLFSRPEVIGPGSGSDADRTRISELERRVARLEAQIAAPATGGGATDAPPEGWMAEVEALRRNGRTIQAIKVYRQHTGVGLKEAKDAVEALPG